MRNCWTRDFNETQELNQNDKDNSIQILNLNWKQAYLAKTETG